MIFKIGVILCLVVTLNPAKSTSNQYFRAIPKTRSSIHSSFELVHTINSNSLMKCAAALTDYKGDKDEWLMGFKFNKFTNTCQVGKMPTIAIKIIRREYNPIWDDDPESIYICASCSDTEPMNNLIVLPGWGPTTFFYRNMSDLVGSNNCNPAFTKYNTGGIKMRYGDSIVSCGGSHGTECYQFFLANRTWITFAERLNTPRSYVLEAIMLDYNEYWIAGGTDHPSSFTPTATTEFFKNGKFIMGPNLPSPRFRACGVKPEANWVVLVGGQDETGKYLGSILYNLDTETFHSYDGFNNSALLRMNLICGLTSDQNGNVKVVAAGGSKYGTNYNTVEILNWATKQWTSGTNIPLAVRGTRSVQYDHFFYVIGGKNPDGSRNTEAMKCTYESDTCTVVPDFDITPGTTGFGVFQIEEKFWYCGP